MTFLNSNKKPSALRIAIAGSMLCSSLLSGCASQQIRSQVNDGNASANAGVAAALLRREAQLDAAAALPKVSRLPYVSVQPISYRNKLPMVFEQAANASIPRLPAWQFQSVLSRLTGINVVLSDDLLYNTVAPVAGASMPADATLAKHNSSAASVARVANIGPLNYTGTMSGMLNYVTDMLNARWSYDADTNTIRIYRMETKVFHISALPGGLDASANLSASSGGSDVTGMQGQTIRTGGAETNTSFKGSMSPWSSISDTVKQMMSPAGSMVVSEPLSEISVRDNWRNIEAISNYITKVNASMTREISVNVKIYQIQVDNTDSRGISWQALYNSLGQMASSPGVSIMTPMAQFSNTGTLVVSPPAVSAGTHPVPWANSQFFVQALSALGKVSTVMDSSVETLNNQPAPFQHYLLTGYLASTTPSLYTGSGSSAVTGASAGLTPGSVETGISLQVLPSVQPDGRRILTQIALSLSTLNGLQTISSAGQSIQVPQISGDKLMPRQMLRSGDSLVIPALITSSNSNDISTPFGKSTWAFGGNRSLSHSRTALVVIITPVAVSKNAVL